jgi:hypothetical protein
MKMKNEKDFNLLIMHFDFILRLEFFFFFFFFAETLRWASAFFSFNYLNITLLEPCRMSWKFLVIVLLLLLWQCREFTKPLSTNTRKPKDDCNYYHIIVIRSHFPEFFKAWQVRKCTRNIKISSILFNYVEDLILNCTGLNRCVLFF